MQDITSEWGFVVVNTTATISSRCLSPLDREAPRDRGSKFPGALSEALQPGALSGVSKQCAVVPAALMPTDLRPAAGRHALGSVRRYNAWLDMDCPNLQVASAVLGSVLCQGPQGSEVSTTTALPPLWMPRQGRVMGFMSVLMNPPAGVPVTEGTTLRCGLWYVLPAGSKTTCAAVCIESLITSELF
ncbi:hypothetical protein VPNG_07187 [Cytospora leucostoma]|uniref:Uncharacterized protein n=1 Tax=Cytospora leucostoma TaxID=1230097 RepID=A0A423WJI2_9PEZI|nr:hypothetical protein VPNG_07187 [Cytospora leucostoma]